MTFPQHPSFRATVQYQYVKHGGAVFFFSLNDHDRQTTLRRHQKTTSQPKQLTTTATILRSNEANESKIHAYGRLLLKPGRYCAFLVCFPKEKVILIVSNQ